MPFDWQTHLREAAQWLLWMASIPGSQDYARQRAREMLSDPIWEGLREEIERQQREAKDKS